MKYYNILVIVALNFVFVLVIISNQNSFRDPVTIGSKSLHCHDCANRKVKPTGTGNLI